MNWLHTLGGRSFGYRDGNDLRTYTGTHAGRFSEDEVYGPDGYYLGEIRNDRLVTRISKKSKRIGAFTPKARRANRARRADRAGRAMPAGCEEFPLIDGC